MRETCRGSSVIDGLVCRQPPTTHNATTKQQQFCEEETGRPHTLHRRLAPLSLSLPAVTLNFYFGGKCNKYDMHVPYHSLQNCTFRPTQEHIPVVNKLEAKVTKTMYVYISRNAIPNNTHTHPFEARDSEWQWHQLGHMPSVL